MFAWTNARTSRVRASARVCVWGGRFAHERHESKPFPNELRTQYITQPHQYLWGRSYGGQKCCNCSRRRRAMFKCMTYGGAAPSGAAAVGTSALDLGFLACYLTPARRGTPAPTRSASRYRTLYCVNNLGLQSMQGVRLTRLNQELSKLNDQLQTKYLIFVSRYVEIHSISPLINHSTMIVYVTIV